MLKKHKIKFRRMKGGGGGGTETVSSIPDWAVPYIKDIGDAAQRANYTGNLGNVADTNPLLQTAFGSAGTAIGDQTNRAFTGLEGQEGRLTGIASSGGVDTQALKDAAILDAGVKTAQLGRDYGQRGTLGSARQAVQQGAQNAATAAAFAKIDYDQANQNIQHKLAAEQGLQQNFGQGQGLALDAAKGFSSLGAQARGIEQETGDAAWQALQRYAGSIYGNPARQQTIATGGGGGK